jgi:hypothetical protein
MSPQLKLSSRSSSSKLPKVAPIIFENGVCLRRESSDLELQPCFDGGGSHIMEDGSGAVGEMHRSGRLLQKSS